jgi:hypothetical protein
MLLIQNFHFPIFKLVVKGISLILMLTRARSARVAGAASLVDECAPMAALRGVVTRSGPPPANHGAP